MTDLIVFHGVEVKPDDPETTITLDATWFVEKIAFYERDHSYGEAERVAEFFDELIKEARSLLGCNKERSSDDE